MANLLFLPVPEFGHIIPPLKLAKALQQRGHKVYYVGFADFESYVRSQGLDYITIFECRYPKGYLDTRIEKQVKLKTDRLSLMLAEAKETNDHLARDPLSAFESEMLRIFQRVEPDLVIVDNMLRDLAALLAHKHGAPAVRLAVHFEEARIALSDLRSSPSYPPVPALVLCPKEIDFSGSAKKQNYYYLEPSVDTDKQETQVFPWERLHEDRPIIYCSLGSQCHQYPDAPGLFRAVRDAVAERPEWQLVMTIGPYLKTEEYEGSKAENIVIVNWAPQCQILERASMMITHGGLGALKECAFFGVPMIVLPCKWDQPYNAARVVHHGIGLRGNSQDKSTKQIHALIDGIAGNRALKPRLQAMSEIFQAIETSGIGVNTIEKLVLDFRRGSGAARSECSPRIAGARA